MYGFNERNELTRTQLTNIWLLSCMYPFMIFHLVLTTKALAAIFTRKRFFSSVASNMPGQIFGMLCCKLAERTGMDFTFAFHQLYRNFCLVISSLDRGGLHFCHLFFSLLWSLCLLHWQVWISNGIKFLFKGQLISKCPFGVMVWTKTPTKKFDNFCHRI